MLCIKKAIPILGIKFKIKVIRCPLMTSLLLQYTFECTLLGFFPRIIHEDIIYSNRTLALLLIDNCCKI